MSIYRKLMEARLKLQSMKLKKTGINKFAGYEYFELHDFLPQVLEIFNNIGLCGIVSYSETVASLSIIDSESPEQKIVITSPMAEASLKGCHQIQNLGAVETYLRRYLWITAMEILEHDALDGLKPENKAVEQKKQVEKKELVPSMTSIWNNAKNAYLRDSNLDAVKERYKLSEFNEKKLIAECAEELKKMEKDLEDIPQ